jgi:deazaflavin-dependent oxidoreductase (nitroreductase family)
MTGNDFMSWVLRSPFHAILSNGMMLITVTGRKTGTQYTTPVGYLREGVDLWVLTSRDRTWWRNLKGGAQVNLLLRRQRIAAIAEPELDETCVEAHLLEYLQHMPQAAKSMSIRVQNGKANREEFRRAARNRLLVRIRPIQIQ